MYSQLFARKLGMTMRRHLIGLCAIAALSGRLSPSSGLARRHSVMANVRRVGLRFVLRLLLIVVTLRNKAFASIALELRQIAA